MSAPRLRALLARLWASPASLLGLALSLALSAWVRTGWQVVDGVIEVAPRRAGRLSRWRRRLPFEAITLGHIVLAIDPVCLPALRRHEHAHVRQYERWGALLLIAYPLASVALFALGRRPYLDNPFEVQAREAENRCRD